MATIEEENAALESRIAQLEASLSAPEVSVVTTEPSGYGLKQLAFDIPVGVTRGVAGLADVLAYLPAKGLQYAGVPVETFGATKLLNALIESDQGLAGPGAAEILGVRPQTPVQEAVEFMTPGPGGKGRLAAQLAREAGYGLTAYGAKEAVEAVAPESPYASIAAAVAAPAALQLGLAGAGRLASALTPTYGVLRGDEEAIRAAAQADVLKTIGPEGVERLRVASMMPSLQTGTGGVPLTAAEIAQTPTAAQLQQSLLSTPEGAAVIKPALETRRAEIAGAIEGLGITPQRGEMAIALRDAAEAAAKQKVTQDEAIASALGISPTAEGLTKAERGKALQAGLLAREESAYAPVKEIWSQVDKKTRMDVAPQLVDAIQQFREFGPLTRKRISGVAKDAIGTARDIVYRKDGLISVGQYQDLRAAANAALKGADKTTDAAEISLMRKLKNSLDSIDESAIITKGAGEELGNLVDAIKATKNFKQTYAQGFVGEILGKRGGELKVKASQSIDRALKAPENVQEIFGKFGKQSDEAIVIRNELLARLSQAKNPTEYLGKNKDLFRSAFADDYAKVVSFAQKKGKGVPLEEFAKITDSTIPNKIFADAKSARRFAQQFADSPILQMGRAKFIAERITKKGNALENLDSNKQIATQLFGDELPQLQKVIADLELSKSPARLERELASGNSITNVRGTSLGALFGARSVLKLLEKGQVTGALTGGIPGWLLGQYAERIAQQRNSTMNAFQAEMLANPQLIKFAAAPPTKENVTNLIEIGSRLGFFGVKARQETSEPAATTERASITTGQIDIEAENMQLEERIKALEASLTTSATSEQESVKVGKQNVSIPQGEQYAPANLVKAVIQVESAGNPEAVSEKGAAGLMQLMPATAKELGVEDRFDPVQNIDGGSRYLAQQIKKFGQPELVVAAYNWGPGNVQKAIAKLKAEGEDITWENVLKMVKVPKETRQYVNKVMALI